MSASVCEVLSPWWQINAKDEGVCTLSALLAIDSQSSDNCTSESVKASCRGSVVAAIVDSAGITWLTRTRVTQSQGSQGSVVALEILPMKTHVTNVEGTRYAPKADNL